MAETLTVTQIAEDLSSYWPRIEPMLDANRDLWELDFTKEQFQNYVKGGFYQLWAFGNTSEVKVILLTEIRDTPLCRVLYVKLAIGEGLLKTYLKMVDGFVDKLCEVAHCSRVELEGRHAWGRVLKDIGATYVSTRFTRPARKVTVG